jgi:SAM-dependent methyltransferase
VTTDEAARAEQGLGYAINAPYYDLIFPRPARDALAGALRELLRGARAVAEIGPGTGLFTEAVLDVLAPGGEVFAVEPTRIMRAALVTRLARLPGAAERVTVLSEEALGAAIDVPLDGVVFLNLIMHFAPSDREKLWRKWAAALRPGGLLIAESQYPQSAMAVAPSVVPGGRLGRYRYDTLTRADPIDDERIRWTMTYRTWAKDILVREETAEFDVHVISDARLAEELTAAGLAPVASAPEGIQAWRRVRRA